MSLIKDDFADVGGSSSIYQLRVASYVFSGHLYYMVPLKPSIYLKLPPQLLSKNSIGTHNHEFFLSAILTTVSLADLYVFYIIILNILIRMF